MSLTQQVVPNVWSTRVALDDFEVRGALILGAHTALVWDTLARPRDMRPYLPLIGARETVIVYSHADWDHIWGTAALPWPARIVSHAFCAERFADDVPGALARKQAAEPGAWDDVVLIPPAETFDTELTIDLGGLSLVLSHLPGHTRDCIVGFVPERGVLLAGDTLETPFPVVPPDAPLNDWLAGLRRWEQDDRVRTVVPAHGPIGGRELLTRNIGYLDALRRGTPIVPTGSLTPFYRETHAKNVAWKTPAS